VARPKTPEPRTEQLNIGLTRAELDSIKKRAESVGMRPVHFGRLLLLQNGKPVDPGAAEKSSTDRLIFVQLSRLGNNLNQMVRHLHATGDPLPADAEPLLKDIRQILTRAEK
jgi:Bacterial mobilisation protein (MobC)